MNLDFPAILVLLVLFCGVVSFVDWLYCKRNPAEKTSKKPMLIDYARSFFPVLLVVLLIRSFLVQPYRVPSGSLEPTVIPGDLMLVNQFAYGLHLPVWYTKLLSVGEPKRGQIALFYWPVNKKITFIKRVIGVPGDHISYINKVLYVNGKEAKQTPAGDSTDTNGGVSWSVKVYEENLDGVKHKIFVCDANSLGCPNSETQNFYNLEIPAGHYLMMGDNRDNSDDSRDWGLVPKENLIGKAMFVFLNWDPYAQHWYQKIKFNRIGTQL
jgi:signal peptidase I